MTLRVGLALLLALALCGLAAATTAPGGPVPDTVSQPAAARTATSSAAAICSAPAAEPSPTTAGGLALPAAPPQVAAGIAEQPIFLLTTCSICPTGPRCMTLHSCVLQGCC
jgi:hypothetical protein